MASDTPNSETDTTDLVAEQLQNLLARQRAAFRARPAPRSYAERLDALNRLQDALYERRMDFAAAMNEDYGGRAYEETLLLEMFVLIDEIRHTKRHLKKWMKPHGVMPNWQFLPSRAKFIYQPLGVVGVIGAWNYQLLLTLSPLIGALSAGNHVMLRPSELAPKTAELMRSVLADCFPEDYVTVCTGGLEVSQAFSSLPFDHLIFTGSTRVGKLIMRNAAEHLTPVTLELGGKSPALVGKQYDLESAARAIIHGKLSNAGQTCVAPDYVLVREEHKDEFVEHCKRVIAEYYPTLASNPDYTHIITAGHYQRLERIVAEVTEKGGKVDVVNPANEACTVENKVFAPTLVHDCPDDAMAVTEEIFGPVLPIVTYNTLDGAIEYINDRPRPLALYYFSNDKSRTDRVLYGTCSGGVTVNGCIYHLPQNNLPFGGVGDSGMGAYHGLDGFETFSKKKAVFFQSRFSATVVMRPPYGKLLHWILGFLIGMRPKREKIPGK